jgi:glutamate--cysteine ligase
MNQLLEARLEFASSQGKCFFDDIVRGIEKENLRVNNKGGSLAQTLHPNILGSSLTNPVITTDFAESLPEIVTLPEKGISKLTGSLFEINQFMYQSLAMQNEVLWPSSMPPVIEDESEIQIANYGSSHTGEMKTLYRKGLTLRYGKTMQVIAGLHYNFSFSNELFALWQSKEGSIASLDEFRSDAYMGLVRNFLRYYWLLPYLFGASPICARTSLQNSLSLNYLEQFDDDSFCGTFATSLRNSGLGYHNKGKDKISIDYGSANAYADSLYQATQKPYFEFSQLGVFDKNGKYQQLNDNLLQIENELYSPIRPKQIVSTGERSSCAIKKRGIEYVEVRVLDLNPLLPLAIDESEIAFMDVFLTFCAFMPSPLLSDCEREESEYNLSKVACYGRNPDLEIKRKGQELLFRNESKELFSQLEEVAKSMDKWSVNPVFYTSVKEQSKKLVDPSLTPSGKIYKQIKSGKSFMQITMDQAKSVAKYYASKPLTDEKLISYKRRAAASLKVQKKIEDSDVGTFHEYIQNYFK